MFTYTVLSDEEIEKQKQTIGPGNYDFEVTAATEETSKSSGNPMIKLVLKVWMHDGNTVTMFDYLTAHPKAIYKIKNFWASVGKPAMYESGAQNDSDYVNQSGRLEVKMQKNDKGEFVPRVSNYLIADEAHAKTSAKDDLEDDLPF